ncbi:UTP--glucose-1-phosphate uridylyltransferase GalU [Derxia lacustris]|uniref:UTP--glucose-1-phosphate uridylyltransferase GalU n=1 Tax=Derxia lacustris TaxID=764842 RepID=UPI000A1731ED|nr:UTP--glucose-1-phosphate uridylyltransferase GalU [Derxia lacustris]
MTQVRKAVFPVAGLGTRSLPATKAIPKEMLTVVDKPLIQYAVEEAVAAGITDMIFITSRSKRALEDHFDKAPELEAELEARGKKELLDIVKSIAPKGVNFIFIRQPEPLGLGHAVLCAQPAVGNEPFAVLLPDDLLYADESVTKQLVQQYEAHGASVLGVMDVAREDTKKYGIIAADPITPATSKVTYMVEKPKPEEAPSTLAVVGRYVLEPQVFAELVNTPRGAGGEIQLTDGIAALMSSRKVVAHRYVGTRYDCGTRQGWWEANIEIGRNHPELKELAAKLLK